MEKLKNSLSQRIMGRINSGEIKAKPKSYFVFRSFGFVGALTTSFLIAVFLASFVVFAMKFNGPAALLTILAFTAGIFILLNFFLAKRFPYFYKKPLLIDFIFLAGFILLASFLVLKTPFHSKMLELSDQKNIPIIGPMYKCACGCSCNSQETCSCQKQGNQCQINFK